MKYSITLFNKWNVPYFYSNNDKICTNTEFSSYETTDKKLCTQIIKDFLDVPETEMTINEVREQFEDKRCGSLAEEKLVFIQNYYNGRLGLYNTIIRDINLLSENEIKCLKYNIPFEYNHFSTYDDEDHTNEKQIEAFIEVKVENE